MCDPLDHLCHHIPFSIAVYASNTCHVCIVSFSSLDLIVPATLETRESSGAGKRAPTGPSPRDWSWRVVLKAEYSACVLSDLRECQVLSG
jgi:hypothetical protein